MIFVEVSSKAGVYLTDFQMPAVPRVGDMMYLREWATHTPVLEVVWVEPAEDRTDWWVKIKVEQ